MQEDSSILTHISCLSMKLVSVLAPEIFLLAKSKGFVQDEICMCYSLTTGHQLPFTVYSQIEADSKVSNKAKCLFSC